MFRYEKMKRVRVLQNGRLIAGNIYLADSFRSRFYGLMKKESLSDGEGLLLMPCSFIHCFFMGFPIDAVYLDKDLHVLYKETVKPWKLGSRVRGTAYVLELAEDWAGLIREDWPLELKERE